MSWKRINVGRQPCAKDCPDRAWDCKITCPKWAEYEAEKQEIYAARLEIQRSYDYTSPMATRIVRKKVTDCKQGRGYR